MATNLLERQVLRRGHQLKRASEPEYGTDALTLRFSPQTTEIENGRIELQGKKTDEPTFVDGGPGVTCAMDRFRHLSLARQSQP